MYIYKNNSKTNDLQFCNIISSFYSNINVEKKYLHNYPSLCERIIDTKIRPAKFSLALAYFERDLNTLIIDLNGSEKTDFINLERIKKMSKFKQYKAKTIEYIILIYLTIKVNRFNSKFNNHEKCVIKLDADIYEFLIHTCKVNKQNVWYKYIDPIIDNFKSLYGNALTIIHDSQKRTLTLNKVIKNKK